MNYSHKSSLRVTMKIRSTWWLSLIDFTENCISLTANFYKELKIESTYSHLRSDRIDYQSTWSLTKYSWENIRSWT